MRRLEGPRHYTDLHCAKETEFLQTAARAFEPALLGAPRSAADLAKEGAWNLKPDDGAVEGETYDAVLWLGDPATPNGRLAAEVQLASKAQ
ncbi:MAG: hypothetical protein NTW86_13805 [Candidatus Sumerlaeota bacterium]|nr:hypothetical protein [Candidatus Sumerlaeota bacterium]